MEPEVQVPNLCVTNLWLIRHAEVEARYQRVFGGRIDMELSPRGHEQANALAAYLHRKPMDVIYASPMRRVQQTLAPLIVNGFPKPVILPELREVDFGDWTGLSWDEVKSRFQISAFQWLDQLEAARIPKAECTRTFRARIKPVLTTVLDKHAGQSIALICHGGVIRMLLAILLELPLPKMSGFEIDYASITQVAILPHKTEVQLLNFTPWRDL
jgi:broad specificity phosphatase PhoE